MSVETPLPRPPAPITKPELKREITVPPPAPKAQKRKKVKVIRAKSDPSEVKKEKKTREITVEDFMTGFDAAKRGSGAFIDTKFKQELTKILESEYKLDLKTLNLKPMMDLWHHYNVALAHLYLTKTLEVLSLPEGTKLELDVDPTPTTK